MQAVFDVHLLIKTIFKIVNNCWSFADQNHHQHTIVKNNIIITLLHYYIIIIISGENPIYEVGGWPMRRTNVELEVHQTLLKRRGSKITARGGGTLGGAGGSGESNFVHLVAVGPSKPTSLWTSWLWTTSTPRKEVPPPVQLLLERFLAIEANMAAPPIMVKG